MAKEPSAKKMLLAASSNLLLLPDELVVSCLARVPRCYYPVISLVSKTFRRLIASPEIYVERSLLGRTEHVLYIALTSYGTETLRCNFKPFTFENNPILVLIPSFPSTPCWGMSILAIGSEIYVLGGFINGESVSTVFVVDCPTHTCRLLPSMKQARACAAVGVVDGKLYVIGGCNPLSSNWVEAFDLKTESWETVLGVRNVMVHKLTTTSHVIDDNIYIMDLINVFVYDL